MVERTFRGEENDGERAPAARLEFVVVSSCVNADKLLHKTVLFDEKASINSRTNPVGGLKPLLIVNAFVFSHGGILCHGFLHALIADVDSFDVAKKQLLLVVVAVAVVVFSFLHSIYHLRPSFDSTFWLFFSE